MTDTYDYDAWGNLLARTGTTTTPYLYDGQAQDSTGLYYLRARYMDPNRGEFESQDPFEGVKMSPLSLHKYLYAGDDSVQMSDPSGRNFEDAIIPDLPGLGFVYTTIAWFMARFESTYIDSWTTAQYASQYNFPDITNRLQQTVNWIQNTYYLILAKQPGLALQMGDSLHNSSALTSWDIHQLSSVGADDPYTDPNTVGNAWIDYETIPRLSQDGQEYDLRMVRVDSLLGGQTFHSYSVNYLAFGVMNALAGHTQLEMDTLITGRKALYGNGKDLTAMLAWANAGYNGWPDGAFTPMSEIQSNDEINFNSIPAFNVVWEPYAHQPLGVQAAP